MPRDLDVDAWGRFMARMVDTLIVLMPLMFIGGLIVAACGMMFQSPLLTAYVEAKGLLRYGLDFGLMIGAGLVSETVLIAGFGGTPGKALLGVRVARADGRKPSLSTAARRYFVCLAMGRGLGLPLISLVTLINAYNHFKEHGGTVWDEMLDLRVTRHSVGWWRWAIAIICWAVVSGFAFLASFASYISGLSA